MEQFAAGGDSGYLAIPPSGNGPGILVLHAWWGLTSVFTGVCDRLAEAGFVALAPDLYAGKTTATIEEAEQLTRAVESDTATATLTAAIDYLRQHQAVRGDGIGVLGFSMGGFWAMKLSALRPKDVAAAVIFYSTGEAAFEEARAAYLGHYAEDDPFEPSEYVDQLRAEIEAAGRAVTFHTYPGTGHWFFEENRPDAFNAEATQLAWERTLPFLRQHLG